MMDAVMPQINSHTDPAFWPNLRQAISASSGFKRWVVEHDLENCELEGRLETLVLSYLRQTLETLAY